MVSREDLERFERSNLRPYACFSDNVERLLNGVNSLQKHAYRTEFQRDRDRIIHSKSFRRLEYKTQVYLTQYDDHIRTRLTHSLEVNQIAKTIAIQLGVNTDLVDAIALGHDVGHTPFGHAGEKKLSELLEDDLNIKFKHNVQSVMIFHELEKKYWYKGLALTIPVLEGILKHTKYQDELPVFYKKLFINVKNSVTIEGQIVAIADEIAQMTHDMDDYLGMNLLCLDDFMDHDIFVSINTFCDRFYRSSLKSLFEKDSTRKELIAIRCLVDYLVTTVIEESEKKLNDGIRAYELKEKYIGFGDKADMVISFQEKIQKMCINNFKVKEMDKRGKNIIETLYKFYKMNPEKLPSDTLKQYKNDGIIVIANHISGMTDRYAIKCFEDMINVS